MQIRMANHRYSAAARLIDQSQPVVSESDVHVRPPRELPQDEVVPERSIGPTPVRAGSAVVHAEEGREGRHLKPAADRLAGPPAEAGGVRPAGGRRRREADGRVRVGQARHSRVDHALVRAPQRLVGPARVRGPVRRAGRRAGVPDRASVRPRRDEEAVAIPAAFPQRLAVDPGPLRRVRVVQAEIRPAVPIRAVEGRARVEVGEPEARAGEAKDLLLHDGLVPLGGLGVRDVDEAAPSPLPEVVVHTAPAVCAIVGLPDEVPLRVRLAE
mmetsp:Transcript_9332/g.20075  ORF Transcript_9332/g.20075 Transcript_9332/m.20075 type:complete len:270 (+) Transcript_9332:456-1265(+)